MPTDWRLKFKGYATKHKQILHNDVSNKAFISGWTQMSSKNLPVLIVVYKEHPSTFTGQNNDTTVLRNNFEIMFLKTVKKNKYEEEEEAYVFCTRLALDFMSRMHKERRLPDGNSNRIVSFNITDCRIEKYALLDPANRFGVSLFFTVGDAEQVRFDQDKWND